MTKPASSTTPPSGLSLPKLDADPLLAAQKANLAAVQEAQNVLFNAAQAILKAQCGWTMDMLANGGSVLHGHQAAKPETFLADLQSTAERTVAVAKQSVDLAAAAQQRVAKLVAQRAAANFGELKTLAA